MADIMEARQNPAIGAISKRALAIKRALIRQYADQFGLEIDGWTEQLKDGRICTVKIINDEAVVTSVTDG